MKAKQRVFRQRFTPQQQPEASSDRWRIDKHIPLALIVALLIQTGGAVWWAGAMSERVSSLERSRADAAVDRTAVNELGKKIERLDERVASQRDILTEIRQRLDRPMIQPVVPK